MKRVTVFVGGIRSVLQSQESEEYMRHVASRADSLLRAVKHENPNLATDKAAVLALINSVDRLQRFEMKQDTSHEEVIRLQRRIERLEAQLKETTSALKEAGSYLEDYEARDELLEAGLIPVSSSKKLSEHIRQPGVEFDTVDPDQLSFTEYYSKADTKEITFEEQSLQTDMIENIYARKGAR